MTNYDMAGSYLLFGCNKGSICSISRWGETFKMELKKHVVALF